MTRTMMMTLSGITGITEDQVKEIAGAFARTTGYPVNYAFNDKSGHAHIAVTMDDYVGMCLDMADNKSEYLTRLLRKEPGGMRTIYPRGGNEVRITVKEAAKRMGVTEQYIRIGLQQGRLPIGSAVRMSGQYTYHIDDRKLDEYLGVKREEAAGNEKGGTGEV